MPGNRQIFSTAMNAADRYRWDSQWAEAAREYQRALAEFPDDAAARGGLGFCYMQTKQWQSALDEYEHILKRDSSNVIALSKTAELYVILNRRENAYKAYLHLAELYSQAGQGARAEAAWQKAVQLSPGNPEPHERLAAYYLGKKDVGLMMQERLAAAQGYLLRGDVGAARVQCEEVLRVDANNAAAKNMLSQIMKGQVPPPGSPPQGAGTALPPTMNTTTGRPAAPAVAGTPATEMVSLSNTSGGNTGIMGNMGSTGNFSGGGNPGSAVAAANMTGGGMNPTSRKRISASQVTGALRQAQTFQAQGRFNDAIDLCEQILESGFDRPDARYFLGWLYQEQQRWPQAIEQFQRLLNDPDYALSCYYALGQCYRACGDLRKATTHFDEAVDRVNLDALTIEESDQLVQLCQEAAEAHRQLGEMDQALTVYNALLGFLSSRGWNDKVAQVEFMLKQLQNSPPPRPMSTPAPVNTMMQPGAPMPPQQSQPAQPIQSPQQAPRPDAPTVAFNMDAMPNAASAGAPVNGQMPPVSAPLPPVSPQPTTPGSSSLGDLPDWLTGILNDADKTQIANKSAVAPAQPAPTEPVQPGITNMPTTQQPVVPATNTLPTDASVVMPPAAPAASPSWLTGEAKPTQIVPPDQPTIAQPPAPTGQGTPAASTASVAQPSVPSAAQNAQGAPAAPLTTAPLPSEQGTPAPQQPAVPPAPVAPPVAPAQQPAAPVAAAQPPVVSTPIEQVAAPAQPATVSAAPIMIEQPAQNSATKQTKGSLEDLLNQIAGPGGKDETLKRAADAVLASTASLPENIRLKVVQAMQDIQNYIDHGLLTSATEECLRVIDIAPQYLDIHQVLCEIYIRQGKVEQAITKYAILIDTYVVNGRIDDAVATYRRILQLEPNNLTYRVRLISLLAAQGNKEDLLRERTLAAESYLRLGYMDRALTELEQALQESPTSVSTRLNYALALQKLGRTQQAVAEYQRVLQVDPRNIAALVRWHIAMITGVGTPRATSLEVLSRIRWQLRGEGQKHFEMVAREYTQAAEIYPNNADVRFALGQIYQQSGYFDQAIDAYQLAMRDSACEVMARVSTAHCLLAQGKPEAAIQQLEQALQSVRRAPAGLIDPSSWAARPREEGEEHQAPDVEISLLLAKAYGRVGREDQQQAILRQVKQATPYRNEVASALAEISARQGDLASALQEYLDLVAHYRGKRQGDSALSVLNEMVRLAPQDPRAHAELADIYISRGLLDEGIAELRLLADIYLRQNQFARAGETLQRIGNIYAEMDNSEEAFNSLRRAVELMPDSMDLLREVVGYCWQIGRTQEATRYQVVIARHYFETQQVKESVAALQQLIALDRDNYEAYDMLGQTYQSVGEYEQASRVYKNLAKVNPGSAIARERLADLQELRMKSV
jgi:tetratricopeptide (TPR) repeat protein